MRAGTAAQKKYLSGGVENHHNTFRRRLGMRLNAFAPRIVFPILCLMIVHLLGARAGQASPNPAEGKTRIAIVGLDHDHVWGLLKYLEAEPDAELVAIAESQ